MSEHPEIDKVIKELGLTLESKFIPWSQSRNAGEKYPSLNWKVTLKKDGKEIVTTDYMAGCGHCPSYKQMDNTYNQRQIVLSECETGYKGKKTFSDGYFIPDKKFPIFPEIRDVLYSLTMDAEVLEYEFEDWAGMFGYDEDSRSAENIYKACMEIALKLNRSLGSDGIKKLQEVYQDY